MNLIPVVLHDTVFLVAFGLGIGAVCYMGYIIWKDMTDE